MKQVIGAVLMALTLGIGVLPHTAYAAEEPTSLVVNEVQTGGATDGRKEFVELYNPSAHDVIVDGWQLVYFAATANVQGEPTRVLAQLTGVVQAGGFVLVASPDFVDAHPDVFFDAASQTSSSSGWLAAAGGVVALVHQGVVGDMVGWGTAQVPTPRQHLPAIPAGTSVQRIVSGDAAGGFAAASTAITPRGGGLQPHQDQPGVRCQGIILSELLPNASGSDTGHEFIEIYNPTNAAVLLRGCSLRLGIDGEPFTLPDALLESGAYRAFSDTETGITLPNTTGQAVWLLTATDEQSIQYPDNMDEDRAWALVAGAWQTTGQPTPGTANMPDVTTPANEGTGTSTDTPAACPAGKERNPETNRCRTMVAPDAAEQSCKSGQERNPETNRCRSVLAASTASLASCKPDQERNPATNRCRSIASSTAASSLKPCAAGQERNPDTNRCRKTANGSTSFGKVKESNSVGQAGSPWHWWLAGIVATGAGGYAVYEWRHEIGKAAVRLRRKHTAAPPP